MLHIQPTFTNSFWGKNEEGVEVIMKKLRTSKQTCVELQTLYTARAAIEEDYGKKLIKLAQSPLGKDEFGTLKESLDSLRRELETMGNSRVDLGKRMKVELEGGLAVFMETQREKRKVQTAKIEKCAKDKSLFRAHIIKLKERLDLETRRVQELEHSGDREKLPNALASVRATDEEFKEALHKYNEIERQWTNDWKESCELFQKLEEERINFLKKSCWDFSNTIATVCVSDDMGCENMRQSLEKCFAAHDIARFIQEFGTGGELPDPLFSKETNGQSHAGELDSRSKFRSSTGQMSNGTQAHTPSDRPASAMYDPRYYYYSGTPDPAMAYRQAAYYHQSRGYYPMDPRNTAAMGYRPPMGYHNRPMDYSQVPGRAVSPTSSQHPMMYYPMVQNRPPWQNFAPLQGQPKGGLIKAATDPLGRVISPPPSIITSAASPVKEEHTYHPTGNKTEPERTLSPASTDFSHISEAQSSPTSTSISQSSDYDSRVTSPNSKIYPTPDSPERKGNDALRSPTEQEKRGRTSLFKNNGLYSPVTASPDKSSPTKASPSDDSFYRNRKSLEVTSGPSPSPSFAPSDKDDQESSQHFPSGLSSKPDTTKDEVLEPPSNTPDPTEVKRAKNGAGASKPHMEVRALYDYEAECDEELSLREGQIVRVTATRLDGWWEGEILDEHQSIQRGLFPSNFTEPVINLDYI
ncbi:formin-binding protein [Basidiobolus ranarum]|uniref:Formin-binding protein n=1 Tax=Basidiobolus ranarum TaxID=34480 RepID=A0ABR2WAK6_9FUNG